MSTQPDSNQNEPTEPIESIEQTQQTVPTKPKKIRAKRGQGPESKQVNSRLGDFNAKNSFAYSILKQKFSPGITQPELRAVAIILANFINITLDRNAKRDMRVLIKWFEENWENIYPELYRVTLYDENMNIVGV